MYVNTAGGVVLKSPFANWHLLNFRLSLIWFKIHIFDLLRWNFRGERKRRCAHGYVYIIWNWSNLINQWRETHTKTIKSRLHLSRKMGFHKRNREISWRKKRGALTFIREILKVRRSPPQKRGYNIWNECNIFYNICLHVGVMGSGNWTDMIINWSHAGKKKGYYFLKKTVIKKVNTISTANREPHIPAHFIRPTVTWFYYCSSLMSWVRPANSPEQIR